MSLRPNQAVRRFGGLTILGATGHAAHPVGVSRCQEAARALGGGW